MLNTVIKLSIQHRWLVLLLSLVVGGLGFFSLLRLPIDAVPDISNKIVQITTVYPALSPAEVAATVRDFVEAGLRHVTFYVGAPDDPSRLPALTPATLARFAPVMEAIRAG